MPYADRTTVPGRAHQSGDGAGAHALRIGPKGYGEIERELASPADALRVALMMLARRGRLEIGDVLKVLAPW
jgi:hypothetical protein